MTAPRARPWAVLAGAVAAAAAAVTAVQAIAGWLPEAWGLPTLEAALTLLLAAALTGIAQAGITLSHAPRLALGARAPAMAALGGAIGLVVLLAALGYAALAGVTQRGAGQALGLMLPLGVGLVVVQAAGEELLFRGWLQPALARDWPSAAALAASALAFSLLHLLGGARAPLSLVNIVLAGLLFGLLRARTGGLAAPIAAHAAYNAAEMLLFGLEPNPGVGSYGALWDIDLAGSGWWGGSGEGLNAAIGLFLALVAALLPLAAGGLRCAMPARAGMAGKATGRAAG